MYRRPATSSIQMPSALAMALRHGVDTDWRRKYRASSFSSVRVSASSARPCQAARRDERFVSPSDWGTEIGFLDSGITLSYRGSSPVSSHQHAPEQAALWIPGIKPEMTTF